MGGCSNIITTKREFAIRRSVTSSGSCYRPSRHRRKTSVTAGNHCREHATECVRLAYLSHDQAEVKALLEMADCWTDLATFMDEEARAALRLVII